MKDTLTEMKTNLQRINSRVDETENQINDLEHTEAKKPPSRTTKRKEDPKKRRQYKKPVVQL